MSSYKRVGSSLNVIDFYHAGEKIRLALFHWGSMNQQNNTMDGWVISMNFHLWNTEGFWNFLKKKTLKLIIVFLIWLFRKEKILFQSLESAEFIKGTVLNKCEVKKHQIIEIHISL